ncbi:hypothetical protein ACSBOX_20235 [Arthrobacter sp. KN11-1C]
MGRAYAVAIVVPVVEVAGMVPGRRKARASRHRSGELALNLKLIPA